MADSSNQSSVPADNNTVSVPNWLKKAQSLSKHEERGVLLVQEGQSLAGGAPTVLPEATLSQEAASGTQVDPNSPISPNQPNFLSNFEYKTQENSQIQPVSQGENEDVLKESVSAPAWLQKAAEKISDASLQNHSETQKMETVEQSKVQVQSQSSLSFEKQQNQLTLQDSTPPKNSFFGLFKSPLIATAKDLAKKGTVILDQAQNAGAPIAENPSPQLAETSVNPPEIPAQPLVPAQVSTLPSQSLPVPQQTPTFQSPTTQPLSPKTSAKVTAEERKKALEAEKIYQEGLATIRDLIAPSSMEIRYDMLRVEGLYAQTFMVYTYPRYLDINWLSPVVNFDVTMDISQFIYPIDSAAIMAILKKKVAQMQSSIRMASEKGMVRDPALETALEDAEELRTQIQRGQEKFFQFALYFTLYTDDEKKLTKVTKQLESLLGGKLILTKKAELQVEHGFNSCLPICLDELEVTRNMNTSPLSTTFPFSSADLTSDEGILYGLNRHNDSLVIFDRFSLENANSVVFAKSGAGKSYAVKLEILRSLMLGTDVIVIDPENEYQALAQTVGGSYLRVSLTSDRRINPFDLPIPLRDEELQPGDLLRSNIINLHGLLKIMLGGVTPAEEGLLDKALIDVYAVKGITMDMLDPSPIPPPTMEDLYDILSTMEGAQSLAQRLQKYTQGTYAGIFNKPTNIDMNSGLMVFSIRDLEDALRPIAMYIILNYIWNRVRSQLKKRLLVIDEAWTLMQHEDSGRFLFGLVKRARKYYLGITTITQDVEDFIKSPYGKPVITNSSMQVLLKQAPSAIDMLAKVFNLTEGEKYMLLNSGVGQGLFFAGLKHVAIQIIASYTEDKIVTTDPEEILKNTGSSS